MVIFQHLFKIWWCQCFLHHRYQWIWVSDEDLCSHLLETGKEQEKMRENMIPAVLDVREGSGECLGHQELGMFQTLVSAVGINQRSSLGSAGGFSINVRDCRPIRALQTHRHSCSCQNKVPCLDQRSSRVGISEFLWFSTLNSLLHEWGVCLPFKWCLALSWNFLCSCKIHVLYYKSTIRVSIDLRISPTLR